MKCLIFCSEKPWHKTGTLKRTVPPTRETIQLHERTEVVHDVTRLILEFVAFGKLWTLRLQHNHALVNADSVFETRTREGILVARHTAPKSECFYLGTADIDENEHGLVSVTTCNNSTRALVITNANDYVLFPWNWKVPYHLRQRLRYPRTTDHRESANKYILEVANLTEYKAHLERSLRESMHLRTRRQQGKSKPIKFPRFQPLREPPGRVVYLELGLVLDKWYIADFTRNISLDKNELIIHAVELINNAQLWYLHPTFGFQMWLLVRGVTFAYDDIGSAVDGHQANTFIDSSCKWTKNTLPDQEKWDAVLLLSSKEGIWNNRVGLSQRSGVCGTEGSGRCSGVSNVKFQMASLARLIAHELLHPLGVADDYEGSTSDHCFTGIMRQGVWQDHDWSVCSVQELERFLEITTSRCIQLSSMTAAPRNLPLIPANVAWRARAEHSSTQGAGGHRGRSSSDGSEYLAWGAWKATDGGLSGPPRNHDFSSGEDLGSCTQTKEEPEPWLLVELHQRYWQEPVQAVLLYNRDDCCSGRLRDFEVRIGFNPDFSLNPLCHTYNGSVPGGRYGLAVIQCSSSLKGRYVSVQIKRPKAILTICEVQVLQDTRLEPFDSSDLLCVDHHPYCPYWSTTGECNYGIYRKFMEANCSYSCGFCQRADTPPWGPAAVHAPPLPLSHEAPSKQHTQCKDKHEYCLHVAANGDCHATFEMVQVCAQSCGFCEDTHHYEVSIQTPPLFVIGGPFSLEYFPTPAATTMTMTVAERLVSQTTMSPVTKTAICVDFNDMCKIWHSRGYCTLRTIQASCGLSCGSCATARAATTNPSVSEAATQTTTAAHMPPQQVTATVARALAESAGVNGTAWYLSSATTIRSTTIAPSTSTHSDTSWSTRKLSIASTWTTRLTTTTTLKRAPTAATTATPTTAAPTTRRACVNWHRSCSTWAAAGHCAVADSVRHACPRSCAVCTPTDSDLLATAPPPPTCKPDMYPACSSWARHGFCFQDRVVLVCPTSCRRC